MTNTPEYHGAQALRAAADNFPEEPWTGRGGPYDRADYTRAWLRKEANKLHPETDPEGQRLVKNILDITAGNPVAVEAAAVARALTRTQFTFANEGQLQAAILDALEAAGVAVKRELILSRDHGRIDLFTAAGVAIEVKVAGTWKDVYRQLVRYAGAPEVHALMLVTTKPEHIRQLPRELDGKTLTVVLLRDGFGVVC